MRRLLASVAVLAAALLTPSAALAVGQPTITIPATPTSATNALPITIAWNAVADALIYRVFRADADCTSNLANVSGDILAAPAPTYVDNTTLVEGTYCYYVQAQDVLLGTADSAPVLVTYDITAPVVTGVTQTGGTGCAPFVLTGATAAADATAVTVLADGQPFPYTAPGGFFDTVTPLVVATDAAGNQSTPPTPVPGRVYDPSGPGPVTLEVTTDPAQQKATLSWDGVVFDGAPVLYRVRTKGPQGPSATQYGLSPPVVQQGLQVDATYEFTLDATDACGRTTSSVRLVRLNDSSAPTVPIVAGPSFDPAVHTVKLSWVAASDNIQVDHYVILRDGVPLGATDATTFLDAAPPQHASLSYIVRAVDTNGNSTDSAPAPIKTPDWTPPTAPVLSKPIVKGSTVTLQWPAAVDNVGVVGYDVFRDDVKKGTMTAARRSFTDLNVAPAVHTWRVRAFDDEGLSATSGPVSATVRKVTSKASVLSLRMVGGGSGAARYSLKPRARLLVDLRVVGTVKKPRLRIYVSSGRGRVTVWRGTPGSSAPRLRLGSALVRHGYVTIRLNRAFHAGRSRLVLIAGGRVVIVAKGVHRPSMKAG